MNPSQTKKETSPLFLSLPDDIILTCLARISRSYYPKLVLVCKKFRSLIVSKELIDARIHLDTHETVFQVRLKLPKDQFPSWYTLWIKPGQILTNQLEEKKTTSNKNIRLVEIPSSCYSYVPSRIRWPGSEMYGISLSSSPSSIMEFLNIETGLWRKAPNMRVAREKAIANILDGKIYVMGGAGADESVNWGEVFDPKTQTWESLHDPGAEHRFSSIRKIGLIEGKIYVLSNEEWDSVYDPKEGKWDVTRRSCVHCIIDDVWYHYGQESCFWYDTNSNQWRMVRGLATFNENCGYRMIDITNYNGKLLILWEEHASFLLKDIWCAVIALERRNGNDEVWGNIEWASIVLTVPISSVFLCGRGFES
ncbi:F-box domain [Arabidopsis suecica]|uniref:F-box domain n=1 Tax=Arabidopsis suecica TaxID=45249 RepID=A0A8T2BTN7_ARASU|nr:F-box domain [Arabidopsis suecica]